MYRVIGAGIPCDTLSTWPSSSVALTTHLPRQAERSTSRSVPYTKRPASHGSDEGKPWRRRRPSIAAAGKTSLVGTRHSSVLLPTDRENVLLGKLSLDFRSRRTIRTTRRSSGSTPTISCIPTSQTPSAGAGRTRPTAHFRETLRGGRHQRREQSSCQRPAFTP